LTTKQDSYLLKSCFSVISTINIYEGDRFSVQSEWQDTS